MLEKRIQSIDVLRGIVMIIMALDHVRNYFHYDAFIYSPTDLNQTNGVLFFTRFITHFCAPVFVFLAGISAYLNGLKKSKAELSRYLLTRGIWMIFVELFIISLGKTFNPAFPIFTLQVIWAIGVSMVILAALIYVRKNLVLLVALALIVGHNLLDSIHIKGEGPAAFLWSVLHEPHSFLWGRFSFAVSYPVLPWVGILALGYYFGQFFDSKINSKVRKSIMLKAGTIALIVFVSLRIFNFYGDAADWSVQKDTGWSIISFLNVTKYPPSFQYILITLGPALIFLALGERPLNIITEKFAVYGRVPFFYYVAHIYLIHLLAMAGVLISGYNLSDMILSDRVNSESKLKGYGFGLGTVYFIWIWLVLILYPLCSLYDTYKRTYQASKRWLTYF